MKGVPLPFEYYQGKEGVVVPCAGQLVHLSIQEPKSVLDKVTCSPSPPTSSSSTLSGGGGGGGVRWLSPEVGYLPTSGAAGEMEDWETVLSESGQEQSILRWIMGDVEEPAMGLNKMLHGGVVPDSGELSGEFGGLDQGYLGFDCGNPVGGQIGNFYQKVGLCSDTLSPAPAGFMPATGVFSQLQIQQVDVKPQLINQNPTFFVPLENQNQTQTLTPPHQKRYNSRGSPHCTEGAQYNNLQMHKTTPFLETTPSPLQLPMAQMTPMKKVSPIDGVDHHHQQGVIDQLFKAAETVQSGANPLLAQSILARLNHQLSPIGKPFDRAAFYFKEALQLLLHSVVNNMNMSMSMNPIGSQFSLVYKIGAYKSFSEVSPLVQFTNFTCNQSLLEVLDGFDHVHVVDFDIKYGDQWASFMQELALRSGNNRTPSLKITTFASPMNDHVELGLTRDNLVHFASELNIGFDFEIVNIDVLASVSWSLPFRVSENEAIAVNLPISTVSNYQIPLPLVLRFVKNLSPKIVVSVDRGCERTDLPFPNHVIHALQSFSNLLESLDGTNMNPDVSQKIERFLIQPSVEKTITGRFSFPHKTQHWRSQFLSSGFSPLTFSNFAESQAVCVIKRTPVRGFHIERRQSSLVLCWQHRELVSASAWRC